MPRLASCEHRRKASEHKSKVFRHFDVASAFAILRTHEHPDNFNPKRANTKSICMHNSGLFCPHQTTGSMVAVLRKNKQPHTVWLAGTSNPCISLYKPFYFGDSILDEKEFITPSVKPDESYWWQCEQRNRRFKDDFIHQWEKFHPTQVQLEHDWIHQDELCSANNDIDSCFRLSRLALQTSKQVLNIR